MSEEKIIRGAVLYTDGGAHQREKIGGCGLHGYVYEESPPKKGAGLAGYVLTQKGYKQKTPEDEPKGPVFIESYVDLYSSQVKDATNNTAELGAFQEALRLVLDQVIEVDKVHIISDSEYTLERVANIDTMKKKDWKKSDGELYKNVEYLKDIDQCLKELEQKGIQLTYSWVKGHNNEPGNVRADMLATIGLNYAAAGETAKQHWITDAGGYWKNDVQYSRLFGAHHIVFPGNLGTGTHVHEGEPAWLYRLYNDAGKQGSLKTIGTSLVSASYGILVLYDKHEELETVLDRQKKILGGGDDVCVTRPQDVYRPATATMLQQFGGHSLCPTSDGELFSAGKLRLTERFNPTLQALNAVDIFDRLQTVFDNVFKEGNLYTTTDVTDKVFTKTIKPAKGKKPEQTEYKLIAHPENDDQYFDVMAKGKVNGKIVERQVRLIYGIDLPARNAMTNAAKHTPQVFVATLVEPDGLWRYYVIVQTNEGMGLWHNPFASLLLPSST